LNVPWIAVPFDVISATLPSETCARKNGLYGTRTRSGALVAREPNQKLMTSRPTSSAIHCHAMRKRGLGGGVDAGCGVLMLHLAMLSRAAR